MFKEMNEGTEIIRQDKKVLWKGKKDQSYLKEKLMKQKMWPLE